MRFRSGPQKPGGRRKKSSSCNPPPPRTAVLCKARWSNRGLRAAARAAERTDEDHLCVSRAAQIWVSLDHGRPHTKRTQNMTSPVLCDLSDHHGISKLLKTGHGEWFHSVPGHHRSTHYPMLVSENFAERRLEITIALLSFRGRSAKRTPDMKLAKPIGLQRTVPQVSDRTDLSC